MFAVARLRRRKSRSGTSGDEIARLDQQERAEQRDSAGEQAERLARRPAVLVPVDDRVHGEHQRGGHGDRARDVDAARRRHVRCRQQPQREDDHGDADRDVDEEDPVPVDRAGEDAAEQDADAAAAGGDEAEHAHRLRAIGGLGEEVHHQRQRHRRGNRAAQALHRARRDQKVLGVRETARSGREREERDAGEEQTAMSEEVAEPAAEQQKAAEGEQVGVHDPRE